LAEILLGIELEVDEPIGTDHCGTCTRCIEACPTNCILEDRTLDASRCISYLSIEFKGHVAPELRPQMEDWIFGCDICQEVCPWNQRFAEPEGDLSLRPQEISPYANLENELQLSPKEFTRKFKGSPVKRAKRRGFLRNIAIAIGNSGRARNVPALARSLKEEMEPLIRGHVAWALGRIGGVAARQALIEASQQEQDEWVMSEIKAALAETR
jgi:epoxyqueuosine reductase